MTAHARFSQHRIPRGGETSFGGSFQIFYGGKDASQGFAVAPLGHPVSMVAKVGDDESGHAF